MAVQLVVYHKDCNDGFCAAWVHWRTFQGPGADSEALENKGYRYRSADYMPAQYGESVPDMSTFEDKEVFIYDFSYPRETLLEIHDVARRLLVIDHHETARQNCEGLPFCLFDMTKSGGRLVWEHWNGPNVTPPWLVRYTEDRDLWNWKLDSSKEANAGLLLVPKKFREWERINNQDGFDKCVSNGGTILKYQETMIAGAVRNPGLVEIGGNTVPCVNTTVLGSEIVGRLAETHTDYPFAAGYFVLPTGEAVYSLRARGEAFDVSAVAKSMGGGGHKAAAGFKHDGILPIQPMPKDKSQQPME